MLAQVVLLGYAAFLARCLELVVDLVLRSCCHFLGVAKGGVSIWSAPWNLVVVIMGGSLASSRVLRNTLFRRWRECILIHFAFLVSGIVLKAPCFAFPGPLWADLPLSDQKSSLRRPKPWVNALNLASIPRGGAIIMVRSALSAASRFSIKLRTCSLVL